MKKMILIFCVAIVSALNFVYTAGAMTLLENCPTVIIKADKQYTREDVLQTVYEQTLMWKNSGLKATVNNTAVKDTSAYNYNSVWSILNNKILK